MKQNEVVMIFEDPITREKPEGEARLVKRASDRSAQDGLEYWNVQFLEDSEGDTYDRWVLARQLKP